MSQTRIPSMNDNQEFSWVDKLNDITYSGDEEEE